jgi:ABC-type multidrug transport system ATPase subunit
VRRDFLRASLEIVREEGKTVLFTSHVLTDVERVVDSVVLVEGGVARTSATLDELKARTKRVVFPGAGGGDGVGAQIVVPGEVSRRVTRGDLLVITEAWSDSVEAGMRARHADLVVEDLNLEEIFVEVLGRKLAPEAA